MRPQSRVAQLHLGGALGQSSVAWQAQRPSGWRWELVRGQAMFPEGLEQAQPRLPLRPRYVYIRSGAVCMGHDREIINNLE